MSDWTPARVERLKKLLDDGYSASQIAAQLGGLTRNAVIGKLHRLKLPGGGKPKVVAKRKPRAPKPPVPLKPRAVAALVSIRPVLPPMRQPANPVRLLERHGRCAFPLWPDDERPGDAMVCGAQVFRGSYCFDHYERTHSKVSITEADRRAEKDAAA